MSASLGVAAFVIVVLELVAAGGAVILLRRFWRQVGPQVQPLLAMFTPAPASVPDREYVPPASTSASSALPDTPAGSPPPGSRS